MQGRTSRAAVWRRFASAVLVGGLALFAAVLAGGSHIGAPTSGEGSGVDSTAAAAPSSSSFYASPNPDDVSLQTTIDASGLCPGGGCDYTYSGLPPGCSSSDTAQLACTPTATGTYSVGATATSGCVVVCLFSNNGSLTLTVNPDVKVQSLSASPNPVQAGQSVTLTAAISGGSAPLTYTWSGLPSSCSSSDSSSISCTPSTGGTFSIGLSVGDAANGLASASVSLQVEAGLSITSFTATPSQVAVGESLTFQISTSGGVAPFSYAYSVLPPGCASTDSATLTCTPNAAGTYSVRATVTDADSTQASASTTVRVSAGPAVTSASWSPSTVDVGQTAKLTVVVTGGASPYTYSYADLPAGCSSSDSSAISCAPTGAGTVTSLISVKDSSGSTAAGSATITVNLALSASFSANRTSGTAPLSVGFTSSTNGGTAPYSYSWSFGDGGSSTSADPDHQFGAVGNYTVDLQVRDGASANASYTAVIAATASTGTPHPLAVHVGPARCGPITVGSDSASDGSTVEIPAGSYTAIAPPCSGYTFSQWTTSGGATIAASGSASTVLNFTAAATLTAVYALGGPGSGAGPGGGHGIVLSPGVRSLTAVGAVIATVWGLVYLGRRNAPRKKAPAPGPTSSIPAGAFGQSQRAARPPPARPSASKLSSPPQAASQRGP